MEKAAEAGGAAKGSGKKGRRGAKRAKLTIDEAKTVKPDSLPEGARFKGYEDFIVQDIVIKPWTVPRLRGDKPLPARTLVVALG